MPKILRARPATDSDEERTVRRLAGARHAPADWVQRGRMIALSWDGLRVPAIAEHLGCHEQTVRRWLERFNSCGLDGLADRGGQGRRRRITEHERSRILGLVKQTPPGRPVRGPDGQLAVPDASGPPEWTLDALTAAARTEGIDVHRSQVRRILLAEGVRWRRTRTWIRSTDPDFAGKDTDRRALHRTTGERDDPLRRRTRPGDPADLPAGAGLVPRRAPDQGHTRLRARTGEDLGLRGAASGGRPRTHDDRILP